MRRPSPHGPYLHRAAEPVLRAELVVLESAEGTLRAMAEREQFWREHYPNRSTTRHSSCGRKAWSLKGVFLISDGSGEIGSIQLQKLFSRRMVVGVPGLSAASARDHRVPRVDGAHGPAPAGVRGPWAERSFSPPPRPLPSEPPLRKEPICSARSPAGGSPAPLPDEHEAVPVKSRAASRRRAIFVPEP